MSTDVDYLLAQADQFVGQGGDLVEGLAAVVRELRERIVTVDIDGRQVRYDKVAECEASLDLAERRAELLDSIVRKIVRGDPHGQAYFDIEMGVVDAHADFTPEEQAYLREVQAEVAP